MKINKKLYSVALVSVTLILFLILVSSAASAQTELNPQNIIPPEITSGTGNTSEDQVLSEDVSTEGNSTDTESIQAATPSIPKTRITTHGTAYNPDIYGDKIVWQDNRNGNWDIYIFDLSAKTEIHTTNLTDQTAPAIYENLVVWEDERNGGHDIYVEDLSAKKQSRVSKSGEAHNPSIYGTKMVWQDERNGSSNIYMYDLSTKKETQITTSGTAYKPDIYGNIVVWEDERNRNNDIFIYDLSTQKETQISTIGTADDPRIYGNKIVWDTRYDYPSALYVYDLSTHKETRISDVFSYKPDIYGNKIVYEDNRNDASGNTDIYMYDFSTNKETMITFEDLEDPENNPYQVDPAIYGDRIVYTKPSYTQGDIYMATLIYPPVAAFSASPISGKKPLTVKFTDKSTGSPAFWSWNFGDKSTSTAKNPVHKYTKAGKYTVSLTVKNAAGSNMAKKTSYITVK
jgi:beta propeller repeat protein